MLAALLVKCCVLWKEPIAQLLGTFPCLAVQQQCNQPGAAAVGHWADEQMADGHGALPSRIVLVEWMVCAPNDLPPL